MFMKKVARCFVFVLSLNGFLSAADLESPHKIAGTWSGNLNINGIEMPLVFTFKELSNKRLTGALLSPHQTQLQMPLSHVSLKDRDLEVRVASVGGLYKGKLSPKTGKIRGEWTQGSSTLPLNLQFSEKGFEMKRPQTPGKNPPYTVEGVRFPNKPGDIVLDGTVTLPKNTMRGVPADVLVSGSGDGGEGEAFIYRNDSGTFADSGVMLEGTYDGTVDWVDFDLDGDLDVFLTGLVSEGIRATMLYRNLGFGEFEVVSTGLPGVSRSSVAWSDYDLDGDLDLLLIGFDKGVEEF